MLGERTYAVSTGGKSNEMDDKNENISESNDTSLTCGTCSSILYREELSEHACFNRKSTDSNEDIIFWVDNDETVSNEETFNNHSSINIDDYDDNVCQEPYTSRFKNVTASEKPKKNAAAMWTDASILALLTCYEAKKEDLDHPIKREKVWALIANDLAELGYKFSGEQIRWKFNTLTRKYKDCVDNNKRTGTGAMTFKFFDRMENILGDRRIVQGQSTISSTFAKKNAESTMSTFVKQRDLSTPSLNVSRTGSISNIVKKQFFGISSKSKESCKNNKVLEKDTSSNTKTTGCLASVSNTQTSKRSQHDSGKRATSKMELEKQWLQHIQNLTDKAKMKQEKQEAYEKRKTEEIQLKKKLIVLKEKQLNVKQNTAKRKLEETAEWHRDKLNIERQKCQLLKELLKTRTSSIERLETDTDFEDD